MDEAWDWKELTNPVKEQEWGMSDDPGQIAVNIGMPGVYVIYEDGSVGKTAVYVGKSDQSVFKRMDRHCSRNEKWDNYELYRFIQARGRVHYYVLLGGNARNRSDYERTLYDRYGGKEGLLNKKDPDEGDCVPMVFPF